MLQKNNLKVEKIKTYSSQYFFEFLQKLFSEYQKSGFLDKNVLFSSKSVCFFHYAMLVFLLFFLENCCTRTVNGLE